MGVIFAEGKIAQLAEERGPPGEPYPHRPKSRATPAVTNDPPKVFLTRPSQPRLEHSSAPTTTLLLGFVGGFTVTPTFQVRFVSHFFALTHFNATTNRAVENITTDTRSFKNTIVDTRGFEHQVQPTGQPHQLSMLRIGTFNPYPVPNKLLVISSAFELDALTTKRKAGLQRRWKLKSSTWFLLEGGLLLIRFTYSITLFP